MAGHSHWAGIKHRKGRADEKRSKIFSKLSKEITVASKLGSKDPSMNPRLRSAIQTARAANMPKDNIERAIKKSEINKSLNYNSLTYEGFGPEKIAIIIEALTDNKNRTASNIRMIFQKNGGSLGTQGSASHNFQQLGVIKIDKKEIVIISNQNVRAYDKNTGFQTGHVSQRKSGDWEAIFSNTEKEILNNQFKEWLIEFEYI